MIGRVITLLIDDASMCIMFEVLILIENKVVYEMRRSTKRWIYINNDDELANL